MENTNTILFESYSEQAWLRSCLSLLTFGSDASDSDKIAALQAVLFSMLKRQQSAIDVELSIYRPEGGHN